MKALREQWLGKTFLHPMLDYLLIGSVWSVVATLFLLLRPEFFGSIDTVTLVTLVLLINASHFAASTVRLYSNPTYFARHPFLTMGLPLAILGVLLLCLLAPASLGRHLQALYLTWSPYHYAAQTFGLTLMYCHRSKVGIGAADRRMLYWICLLPFIRSFLGAQNSGLGWFVSREQLAQIPFMFGILDTLTTALMWLTFILPVVLILRFRLVHQSGFPLIGLCMMIANGIWWIFLDFIDAFVIATIAHSLQYMAIVLIAHTKDRTKQDGNSHGPLYHASLFYFKCLVLGYALFYCWPYALVLAGAGLAESMLLVIATINIHHFIVDRYIWRAPKPSTTNVAANAKATLAKASV